MLNKSEIIENIKIFETFPYKKNEYKKRNWGHPNHSLCSYPSKMKPSIANVLIKNFTNKDDIILDPFSGCGTIPFEACNEGRIGIGVDLSPFAYFLTQAKIDIPSKKEVNDGVAQLKKYIKENINRLVINNELVATLPGIIPYMMVDNVISGKNNGIYGGIKNIIYSDKPFTLRNIRQLSFTL